MLKNNCIKASRLNWDRLRIFYWVAKFGSFSRAAKALKTSQPALSHQIGHLEDELENDLFVRVSQGIKLTQKGEELFFSIRDVFLEIDTAIQRVKEDESETEGTLRISASQGFISNYLSPKIPLFIEKYPKLRLSIAASDFDLDPANGDLDVVIRPKLKGRADLIQHPIMTMHLRLYASRDYIQKYGLPQKISDLNKHRLIAHGEFQSHPYADLDWHLKVGMPEGESRKPFLTLNGPIGRTQLAEDGVGIILIPNKHPAIRNSKLVNILPKERGPKIDLFCIYPKRLKKLKKIVAFSQFIQEVYQ